MAVRTLRDLQLIELDMLKEVLRVLDKLGLTYCAIGGTLLGAVRHHGFIPWDDDIDIAIPRPDYERFLAEAEQHLPRNLRIKYFRTQKASGDRRPVYACQVIDKNVELVQHIANKPIRTNVWIDLFPLDGMPGGKLRRKVQSIRLLSRRMWIQFSMFDENVHQHREGRPWHERMLMKFYRVTKIGSGNDPYDMMEKMDRALRKYPFESPYIINFMGAWKLKEMFPAEWFGKGTELPFEDMTIRVPENYDAVLTQMYGDYMTPIRDEKAQLQHHSIEIIDR